MEFHAWRRIWRHISSGANDFTDVIAARRLCRVVDRDGSGAVVSPQSRRRVAMETEAGNGI
jgi:hypothetical protein